MLDIFSGLRLVVKRRSISIDNAIFRCHWFFTSTLLVSFSLVITARQYVGQPIECHSINKIPDSLLNSYCWVQSTFSVPQACNQQVGSEVPYPCIDNTRGREIKMFAYYQWVGMVLFIQGLMFHLPYYLWKVWENGLIRAITGGLRVAVLSDQEREKKKEIVVEYIHNHLGCHKRYALKYFLCEFICLINLLAQLWATNKFFDGQFLNYGISVLQYSSNSLGLTTTSTSSSIANPMSNNNQTTLPRMNGNIIQSRAAPSVVDPMTYIFPRITKCTYYDFGSSGDVQKHDALCLLPLNIINEKIYIALWFWFLVLAILTLLVIIYRLLAIGSEQVRCKGLVSRCKLSNELDIRIICRHCDVGDWFLFYMVAENLDPLIMREIVASIANKIRAHFELKRELTMLHGDHVERDSMYKVRPSIVSEYRGYRGLSQSFDESIASTRRNSLVDEVPLVKKITKKLYSKRLWSMDLGSGELRQQLFGQQPAMNPDHEEGNNNVRYVNLTSGGQSTNGSVTVSAPPAGVVPLNSAAPRAELASRRGSLSRASSTGSGTGTSGSNSFIMEMQNLSTRTTRTTSELCANRLERRSSVQGSVLRHREPFYNNNNNNNNIHTHHQSIRDLRLTGSSISGNGIESAQESA